MGKYQLNEPIIQSNGHLWNDDNCFDFIHKWNDKIFITTTTTTATTKLIINI